MAAILSLNLLGLPTAVSASSPISCVAPAGSGAVARTVQAGTVCEIRFTATGSPGTNTWTYEVPAGVLRVAALLVGAGGNSFVSQDGQTAGAGGGGEVFYSSNLFNLGNSSSRSFQITAGYADTVDSGLTLKADVVVASQAPIDLTTGGLLTIDSVTLTAGSLVLVKDQFTASENGIYVAGAGAWSRWTSYDTSNEIQAGDLVRITGGSQYAVWRQTTASPTLGTSSILWEENWEFLDAETEIRRSGGNHFDAMGGYSSGILNNEILAGQSGAENGAGRLGGAGPVVAGQINVATGGGSAGDGLYSSNPTGDLVGGTGKSALNSASAADRHLWSDLGDIFASGGSYDHNSTSSLAPTQGLGTGGKIGRDASNPNAVLLEGGFGSNGTAIIRFFTNATPTVTFFANGGTGTMSAQVSATDVSLSSNGFEREGFTFVGWNGAADGDSSVAYAPGASYPFSTQGSDFLYAQWIPEGSFLFNKGEHKRGNSQVQATRTQSLFQPGGSSIEIGNDMLIGDYVDFYDVTTVNLGGSPVSVGARVTFLSHFGSTGDSSTADELDKLDGAADMDESENNYLLKSEIDFDTDLDSQDSFVEVNIAFFRDLSTASFLTSNTPTPVTLTDVQLSIYDLDNAQFVSVEGDYRVLLTSDTEVQVDTSSRFPYRTFVSPNTGTSGEASFTVGRATLVFNSVQEFNLRMGVKREAVAASDLDEESATYLFDFGPGLPWGSSNITPVEYSQPAQAIPAAPSKPYEGPLNLSHSGSICSGSDAVVTGQRLSTIEAVYVGDKLVPHQLLADGRLSYSLKDIPAGNYIAKFWVPVSSVNLTSQITVGTCSTSPAVTGPGTFTATKLFANYRGDRGPVVARDLAAITSFIRQYPGITTVTCVGSTSGVPAKRTDAALARARAKNACGAIQKLVPTAKITLATSTGKGVGQRFRSVTVTVSGTR